MTRATQLAAAVAVCGRARTTDTAASPHVGATHPVLPPRSLASRSLASSEGSSPDESGKPGRGRRCRDHRRRPTSVGRRVTTRWRKRPRHRRVIVGPLGGHIGGKHRDRRAQASTASRRSRTVQERLRRFRRSGPRRRRRRVGLPGGRVERPCLGHRHDGRRRLHAHIRPESTSPSIIHPSGEHEGRSDVEGRRRGYRHHGRRRCGDRVRDTRRGRARSRIDRPEAAFPSRWPRPGRRWGCSSRGHEPRHAERVRSGRRGERRRRRPGGSPGTVRRLRPQQGARVHVDRQPAAPSARGRRRRR